MNWGDKFILCGSRANAIIGVNLKGRVPISLVMLQKYANSSNYEYLFIKSTNRSQIKTSINKTSSGSKKYKDNHNLIKTFLKYSISEVRDNAKIGLEELGVKRDISGSK